MLRLDETSAGRRFAYDGGTILAEYNTSDALQARHVFGPGADEALVTIDVGGNRSWLIADERGSIVAKTDASGAATAIMAYDGYGIASGSDVGRFRYTGQAWLPELGLSYYKARMYAPSLGRFMQTDPIGYADGLNLYAYVGNDPVNASDPSGMQGQKPCPDGKPPEPDSTGGVSCGLLVTARLGTSRVWVGSGVEINGGGAGAPPQNGTPHNFVIGPLLSPCPVSSVMNYFKQPGHSAPGAPAAQDGTRNLNLTGNNPISQYVNSSSGTIINTTLPSHMFYPGSVTIQVTALSPQTSTVTITGTGTGKYPGLNNFIGKAFFGGQAAGALNACGR